MASLVVSSSSQSAIYAGVVRDGSGKAYKMMVNLIDASGTRFPLPNGLDPDTINSATAAAKKILSLHQIASNDPLSAPQRMDERGVYFADGKFSPHQQQMPTTEKIQEFYSKFQQDAEPISAFDSSEMSFREYQGLFNEDLNIRRAKLKTDDRFSRSESSSSHKDASTQPLPLALPTSNSNLAPSSSVKKPTLQPSSGSLVPTPPSTQSVAKKPVTTPPKAKAQIPRPLYTKEQLAGIYESCLTKLQYRHYAEQETLPKAAYKLLTKEEQEVIKVGDAAYLKIKKDKTVLSTFTVGQRLRNNINYLRTP